MTKPPILDDRLLQNAALVAQNEALWLILKNEMHYPWLVLVPKAREQSMDLLDEGMQTALLKGIGIGSRLIRKLYETPKVNVASLGNIVPTLHVHIVGRQECDPLWPEGIWQRAYEPCPYSDAEFFYHTERMRHALAEEGGFEFMI